MQIFNTNIPQLLCKFSFYPCGTKYVALNKRRWYSKLKSAGISTFNGTFLRMCVRAAKNEIKNAGCKIYQSQKNKLFVAFNGLMVDVDQVSGIEYCVFGET
jgi:hypothetical protein